MGGPGSQKRGVGRDDLPSDFIEIVVASQEPYLPSQVFLALGSP